MLWRVCGGQVSFITTTDHHPVAHSSILVIMLGILVAAAVFLEAVSANSLGIVNTEGGAVQGENIRLGTGRHMDVFKGIPFAAPPGRFEKPKRHSGWDGTLKTTSFKPRCLQLTILMNDVYGSEDCLYLNIWVPHINSLASNLPVMVWIYGGAFLVGASQGANFLDNYLYSGQELAERGNVIVVTLGYRVGSLGFLSAGDSTMPGNYGLWDQQAAIAWVYRNIRSFGGDPSNITVFGESAGGASVNFQILTPHNKGMIKRAISQSGVALSPWAINQNPRKFAEEVALQVNCPIDSRMATCLRMTDPKALTLAGKIHLSGSPDNPLVNNLALSPVIDGDFLPDDPSNLFHNAADVDYMAGANDMDGHIFTGIDVPSINSALLDTPVDDVKRLLSSFTKDKGTLGFENAFSTYTLDWGTTPSRETVKKTVVAIETDYLFLIPTQAALYLHASNSGTGRTYSYLFSEPNRMGGLLGPYPSWMGADHADDLQYVFGKPFSTPLGYAPRHRDASGYMIAYWTNFAKTGDPNRGSLSVPVSWPQFSAFGHQFVEINGDMDSTSVGEKLRLRFVNFWTNILPNLPTMYADSE
uniref:Carboxylic ester hydrolase n=2 Tax=Poecilia formosa TaxID=48698 RepID=A0A087XBD3_POEFO